MNTLNLITDKSNGTKANLETPCRENAESVQSSFKREMRSVTSDITL
jgi:hypothetical protein